MLFFLSGEIQTGKTRWLELLVSTLESKGVSVQGVLAPGVWHDHGHPIQGGEGAESRFVDENGFEKTGIDNLLLPDRKLVSFARREDLARSEGAYDEHAQSARMDMHWHIADEAVREVNAHLAELPKETDQRPGLLVIDELGRLELLAGGGLFCAMRLLEAGPTPELPHALVVVRSSLIEAAVNRFPAWGDPRVIAPQDEFFSLVLQEVLA